MRRAIPARPVVGDAIVADGAKYRISIICPSERLAQCRREGEHVHAKQSFGGRLMWTAVASLTWDKVAGVWRVAT